MTRAILMILAAYSIFARAEPVQTGFSGLSVSQENSTSVFPEEPNPDATTLSCTCTGGPGNYPYHCEPVHKICFGGPGNYPYDCTVCP